MKIPFKLGIFHVKRLLLAVFISSILFTFIAINTNDHFGRQLFNRHRQFIWTVTDKTTLSKTGSSQTFDVSRMTPRQRDYCLAHGERAIKPDLFEQIYYDDKYKLLYCSVPKVACTNWFRMLLVLTGKVNVTDPTAIRSADVHGKYSHYLTKLSNLSADEIRYRLDNYYKFVFTRDPFERVLSAYKNKFKAKNPYFHNRYGKKIIEQYRVNPKKSSRNGDDVTFPEFVQYLTDNTRTKPFEDHWQRITELCHPCLVKYDFIGSMDNMNADSDHILEKIGASKIVKFPSRSARYKQPGTATFLGAYYSKIPIGMLDQLLAVYSSDFIMFNLTVPKHLKDITKWNGKI